MCGRFVLDDDGEGLQEEFGLQETPYIVARYNIAPTQPVAAIGISKAGHRGLTHFHWGFIPSWAKDGSMASRMINARAETVGEKPSYRNAFKRRRCIIPVSGFYEWKKDREGKKQPVYIHPKHQGKRFFGFAGLWENWESDDGSEVRSCTILTTSANDLMAKVHDRMPVILNPADYDTWMHSDTPMQEVYKLLKQYPPGDMTYHPVSTYVNSARNEGPQCIVRV
ncbi:MAG: SOS response-associated peptidase [Anaerolineae bacterium]